MKGESHSSEVKYLEWFLTSLVAQVDSFAMKGFVFFLSGFLVLASCAAATQIPHLKTEQSSIKNMRSRQYLTETSGGKLLKSTFLFNTKNSLRPLVTVKIRLEKSFAELVSEGSLMLRLDQEKFQLELVNHNRNEGVFLIPENLWIPFVYSQDVGFSLDYQEKIKSMELTSGKPESLKQFFIEAINRCNLHFPALPPGEKKW